MGDPLVVLSRLIGLVYIPALLLCPLAFAALVPNRASNDADRIAVRGRLLTLGLVTLFVLTLWLGLVLTGLRLPVAREIADFWWLWFFPLWFGLAMPAVARKRPDWRAGAFGRQGPSGMAGATGDLRTASLVNRERQSPVTRPMWALALLVSALAVGAIAARGMAPFPLAADAMGASGATEAWRAEQLSAAQRQQWTLLLVVVAALDLLMLAILPRVIRSTLADAEPMDAAGSDELAALYARQRRRRALGLFWLLGVVQPATLGAIFALVVWFPDAGSLWGLLGGGVGTLLGLGGAIFGVRMTVERTRIAEVRARLQPSQQNVGG
jgi:hypothetical protein